MGVYLDYAARGRNDWWRYLLSPVLAFTLSTVALTLIAVVLILMHLLPSDLAARISQPRYVAWFYFGLAASFGALAAALALMVAIIHKKRPRDLIGQWRWRFFVQGFVAWFLVQTVLALLDLAIAPNGFSVSANNGTLSLASAAFVGILVQTFAEEYFFRGYVTQGLLLAFKKPLPAAIVSGLLFGSVHIPNGLPQALNAVVFGIVCSMIAIRAGGIALTCGLHLANNYFGAVVLVSGNDVFKGSPGIFTQTTPQLVWWDLVAAVIVFLGALCLIYRRPYFDAASGG